MIIPFIQYLRPHGRKKNISIEVDQVTGEMAKELINAGARFEIEELSTGLVSLECINAEVDEDDSMFYLAGKLAPNTGMKKAVAELIKQAYERMFRRSDDSR